MLNLVGLGLYDHKDISQRGLEAIRRCDSAYIELYTNPWRGSIQELEKLCSKRIKELVRSDLEENSARIIREAKEKDVVVLVPGDPLVATTHASLIWEARSKGIETRIIHSSSIYSAIAETGLHIYKFGKTATIAIPEKNYFPETPYNVLKQNLGIGAHTLFLLDVKKDRERYMSINEAIEVMLELEKRQGKNIFKNETLCIGCARLGSEDRIIRLGKAKDLLKIKFGKEPHVLIVPSELHFSEKELLEIMG